MHPLLPMVKRLRREIGQRFHRNNPKTDLQDNSLFNDKTTKTYPLEIVL